MTDETTRLRDALLVDFASTGMPSSVVREVDARLDALIAAVRAETLAGAGVVEVCEQVSEGWPCGQTRDRHDGAYISHPYQPATPPTPVLTAARCGYLIRMLGLTPFICNRAEDDALHRSRTHPDAHAFLATPDPEATDG